MAITNKHQENQWLPDTGQKPGIVLLNELNFDFISQQIFGKIKFKEKLKSFVRDLVQTLIASRTYENENVFKRKVEGTAKV